MCLLTHKFIQKGLQVLFFKKEQDTCAKRRCYWVTALPCILGSQIILDKFISSTKKLSDNDNKDSSIYLNAIKC